MNLPSFAIAALLAFGGNRAVLAPQDPAAVPALDEFADLLKQFESAHATWQTKLKKAARGDRRVVGKQDPTPAFWARFKRLSDGGDGQATFWLIQHMRNSGLSSTKQGSTLTQLYRSIIQSDSDAEWFEPVPNKIYRHRRSLGEEVALELYGSIVEHSTQAEVRASALFHQHKLLRRSKSEDNRARSGAVMDKLLGDFPNTSWAEKARTMRLSEQTQVGAMAPDFEGKTIDGQGFRLSDYRGKVVLLNFFGFW